MALPPLRYLDIAHIDHDGERAVVLRDTEGFVEDPLVLTPIAFFVAAQLNGENDVPDIQYQFSTATGGRLLRAEDVMRVVEVLDQHGFLLSDHYLALRNSVIQNFEQSGVRPAFLAGKSYPADPVELRTYIDGLFMREEGPRVVPQPHLGTGDHVRCLIVPHIDFERGGHSYAHGYLRLAERAKPDTVFVFGVVHAGAGSPFILTRKHFDTPLGAVETDIALVDGIAAVCPWNPFEEEIAHRTEHSIEFQAVMLAYLYGPEVKIVPILCGPFLPADGPDSVTRAAEVDQFLDTCRAVAADSGKRITVIAGADLAHVGQRFGDAFDIDDTIVEKVQRRDEEDLVHVTTPNPDAWYRSVMRDENERRVCGLNCIYAAMRSVEGSVSTGELLHYGYAPDPAGGIVSFANVVFRP